MGPNFVLYSVFLINVRRFEYCEFLDPSWKSDPGRDGGGGGGGGGGNG